MEGWKSERKHCSGNFRKQLLFPRHSSRPRIARRAPKESVLRLPGRDLCPAAGHLCEESLMRESGTSFHCWHDAGTSGRNQVDHLFCVPSSVCFWCPLLEEPNKEPAGQRASEMWFVETQIWLTDENNERKVVFALAFTVVPSLLVRCWWLRLKC